MKGNILYLRNFANEVDLNSYNLQEIGLCKELVKKGYNCDIVYYSKNSKLNKETLFEFNGCKLQLLWMPSLKVFHNSVFPLVLKRGFLEKYSIVITTEYNQMMTYLLAMKLKKEVKLVLYHGPYKETGKEIIRKMYDKIFLKRIIQRIDYVFVKSKLAKKYLQNKGFSNVKVIGVGIDKEKFQNANNSQIGLYTNSIKRKKNILYIGKLEKRRNIDFLFAVFADLKKEYNDLNLILIGSGEKKEENEYFNVAKEMKIYEDIIHIPKLNQNELIRFYEVSDVFVFPSSYEIFGMVLLESLYFGLPIITTKNGGSDTLIENGVNGYVMDELLVKNWSENIKELLTDANLSKNFSVVGKQLIDEKYNWDVISNVFLEDIGHEIF